MGCSASIASGLASLWLAAHPGISDQTLVIGTEDHFAPYVLRDAEGGLSGFEVELMNEICRRQDRDCQWQTAPFSELIPGVAEGRFDLAIGALAITPERRRIVDFSQPYLQSDQTEWFVGFPDAPAPDQALIAVEAGTIHEAWLRDQGLHYQPMIGEARVLAAVLSGKADLALGPYAKREETEAFVRANGMTFLYDIALPDEGTGIALCRGDRALKAMLDMTISEMTADGTLARLNARWF